MRAVHFYKVSPGGNTTLLLEDQGFTAAERSRLGGEVIRPLHLQAEQAGFIDAAARRLDMAGGEFCCNATRAFGAVLALTEGDGRYALRVSGMDAPVTVEIVRRPGDDAPHVAALLPLTPPPPRTALGEGAVLVRLPGIVHLLLEGPAPVDWEAAFGEQTRRCGLEAEPAVGVVWWERAGADIRAVPVVRVLEPFSLCRETSCGSGAVALAVALGTGGRMMQPSGLPLDVTLEHAPGGLLARVDGPVRLLARGEVFVDE